ncbi:hypothetical protein PMIT1323_00939 [Prochlorococcus marinus str. MIT 1323]|nr:hypothetical protein PMIT1323_00939 [Prochlorococcus marinus str. MIT 1323]
MHHMGNATSTGNALNFDLITALSLNCAPVFSQKNDKGIPIS